MVNKASYQTLQQRIIELEIETRQRARVEKELQFRLEFENLITSISSDFINLKIDHIDASINEALKRIGEFVHVDRSYIFRYNAHEKSMDNTHEWCAPGVPSYIHHLKNIPFTWSPWLISQINAAQVVHIPDVNQLPEEAATLKTECLQEGIKSLVLVPTEYAGSVIGFLGLDSVEEAREWSNDEIALLRFAGEIFANALERKRTEEGLRWSEEKYRTILESVEESYWEVNLRGEFQFFSPSLSRLLGYSREELMGMNYRNYVSPRVAKKIYKLFNKTFKSGKSVKVTDFEHITKDGKIVTVEMSVALMRDENGQVIGFRGVSRDVTDRKIAEQALTESEERYRTVLEANPDPVIVYDMDGRVVYFNPAFSTVFGWMPQESFGKTLDEFVPQTALSGRQMMAEQVQAGKSFSDVEAQRCCKDGTLVPVSISGAVYKDVTSRPMGSVITIRDIREKKKLEAQLLNVRKMESVGTLAGGIAHDFNNLLMSIQGNLTLVLMDLEEDHPHRKLLENIEKNVESGSRLTTQLLRFARRGKYEIKPIHVNGIIRSVTETFARTRKELTVCCDLANDLDPVEADEGQIEQVLLNLLVNASHAMPAGGEICLKSRNVKCGEIIGNLFQPEPGNYVMLSVTDTGYGMDKEVLAHVFEPFFTTKAEGEGTGLGLASAYGIIKGHGGYIDVESQVGKGTTFCVYLPATVKKVPEKLKNTDSKMVTGNGTILLVDDEEMVLDVAFKMLKLIGYNVLIALEGKEAIDIYNTKQAEIDLVILDVIMPTMSGSDVYDQLKKINPNVKVLLSSGYSSQGNVEELLERGCDGFIQKPFNVRSISSKIKELLS